jgi:hypothetical protein
MFLPLLQMAKESSVVIAKMDATANDVPSAYDVRGSVFCGKYSYILWYFMFCWLSGKKCYTAIERNIGKIGAMFTELAHAEVQIFSMFFSLLDIIMHLMICLHRDVIQKLH